MRLRHLILATSALVSLGITSAVGNPQGAQVVGGSATVQGQGTANVIVRQSTDKAIINWSTFNIGNGETTRFVQPSASSIALNRVTGGLGPSQIFGSLSANGRVFLVNPDGILFGPNSKIDTAGFLGTTRDIKNDDFMAGRFHFTVPGRPDASIVNQGIITAQTGGFAALVAPGVRNTGTITAKLGKVGLAAGNDFTLDFYGDKLITLGINDTIAAQVRDVSTGQPLDALVKNEGKLKADGGRVELTASAARQIVDSVINNKGVIEANSIGRKNGMIVLGAATAATKGDAPAQTVKLSGTISSAGQRKGTKGGKIEVTGENIELAGAKLDASGRGGGGKILIGGDTGGGMPHWAAAAIRMAALEAYPVPKATTINIDRATVINASAKDKGDGGKIVVWADGTTAFGGAINASGGSFGGDGGFAEVSGRRSLNYYGLTNTRAINGKNGTLLLDPDDFLIDASAASTIASNLATSNVTIQTTAGGSGGSGDISVNSAVIWNGANTLTLDAYRNIAIDAPITGTNGGLTLIAGNSITASAGVNVGTFTLQAGAWSQVATSLPSFTATDFRLTGGSYLRANGGDGSAATPYQLVDIYGVQGIGSSASLLTKQYILTTDVDAAATATWNSGAGLMPIGNLYLGFPSYALVPFSGSLNGQNYTISGLHSSARRSHPLMAFAGLFGTIASSGTVSNLRIRDMHLIAGADSVGYSTDYVGGIAGQNYGSISNSYTDGSIVQNPPAWIASALVGGLVGFNSGNIIASGSSAVVSGATVTSPSYNYVGGLVGQNSGTIGLSFFDGSVSNSFDRPNSNWSFGNGGAATGGLVAYNNGTITQSFSLGQVTVSRGGFAPSFFAVGGLVGQNNRTTESITESYSAGSVTVIGGAGWDSTGGMVGKNYGVTVSSYWDVSNSGQLTSDGGIPRTTVELKSALPSGFDPSVWAISASVNSGYPYLQWQFPTTATPPITQTQPSIDQLLAATLASLSNQPANGVNNQNTQPQSTTTLLISNEALARLPVTPSQDRSSRTASLPADPESTGSIGSSLGKITLSIPSKSGLAGLPEWEGFSMQNPETLGRNAALGHGYCTDYVKKIYTDNEMSLPFKGDAGTWFAQAASDSNYKTLDASQIALAPAGAIAVWDNGGYGHVALVKANDGKDSISFAEANWGRVDTALSKPTYDYMKQEAITKSFNKVDLNTRTYNAAVERSGGEYRLVGFIIPK